MEALVWIDIETTGLDPVEDEILEISLVVREHTPEGAFIDSFGILVRPVHSIDDWEEFIDNMHSESGLKADLIRQHERLHHISYADSLMDTLMSKIKERLPDIERFMLAGSSVHFDQAFLKHHCPKFMSHMSHRMIDISSLKAQFRACNIEFEVTEIEPKHRAWSDVQSSYNWYWEATQWIMDKKSK